MIAFAHEIDNLHQRIRVALGFVARAARVLVKEVVTQVVRSNGSNCSVNAEFFVVCTYQLSIASFCLVKKLLHGCL